MNVALFYDSFLDRAMGRGNQENIKEKSSELQCTRYMLLYVGINRYMYGTDKLPYYLIPLG